MRFQNTISLLSAVAVVSAQQNAPEIKGNPSNTIYRATLPAEAFDKFAFPNGGNINGTITARAGPDGVGVTYEVDVQNFRPDYKLLWHVHEQPVPADGNCTETKAHLDPYKRGEDTPCNNADPQTCQVGDLSGKYGKINGKTFKQNYTDKYTSIFQGTKDPKDAAFMAFIGSRSVVIHFENKTRITCANFELVKDDDAPGGPATTSTGKPTTTSTGQSTTLSTATGTGTGTGSGASASNTVVTVNGAGALSAMIWTAGAATIIVAIFAL